MKLKLLSLALFAVATLFGCKETSEKAESVANEAIAATDDDFNAKVEVVKALFKAHEDEDIAKMGTLLADTLKYSPSIWNDNQWLGKDEFLARLGGMYQAVENLKFNPGIVLPNTTAGTFFAGRNFPVQESSPQNVGIIRAYGSWSSTIVESGETNNIKWYGLFGLNEDNKIAMISAYFNPETDTASAEAEDE
ncbi:MAG: nuclear transport factor 2 family protein [Flavobacteriaceae bacterium]|nr:nuclear transport factor 2 family protein [Flavobacteriaceae bacterium]